MINIFIKELEKESELIQDMEILNKYNIKMFNKIVISLKKKFNIISIRKIDDNNYIYIIPNANNEKVYEKINKKVKKFINEIKNSIQNKVQIILDSKTNKYKNKFTNLKIVDGKETFENLLENILKYIGNNIELQDIYIVTNIYDSKSVSIINYLLEKVKTINIVTKDINKYSMLEENIYNEKGIVISVSNNKKKSLKKASIIININLNKEEFLKYSINRNSIIINLLNEKMDYLRNFDGIVINNAQINLDEYTYNFFKKNNLINNFSNIELYESISNISSKYSDGVHRIKYDNISLKSLIGNNGIIDKKQIINNQKLLTN